MFGNNLLPHFTAQSWIQGKTDNHVMSKMLVIGCQTLFGSFLEGTPNESRPARPSIGHDWEEEANEI
jgi:hypothetical protein